MADRAQINQDLGLRSPLRGAASPTDPYYQVKADTVQLEGGGDFADLAKSVGAVVPVLDKILSEEEKYQQDLAIKEGRKARLTNQKSFKEAQQSGLIRQAENPWFVKGYLQQDGRISGMNYDIAMRTAWASSEAKNSDNPQDFQKFQSNFRSQWIHENDGRTADWMDGFAPAMQQADNNMAAQHVAYRQNVIEQTQKDNTGIEIGKMYTAMTELLNAPETRMVPGADAALRESYTARITAMGKDLVAKGMNGKDFNAIVAEQTISFARQNGDESLLAIGQNVQTGNGTVGGISTFNAAFTQAEHQIRAERYQMLTQTEWINSAPDRQAARVHALKSIEHSEKEWANQQKSQDRDEQRRGYLSAAVMALQAGKREDSALMADMAVNQPEAYAWYQNFKHTQMVNKAQIIGDQMQTAQMMMRIDRDASTVSVQDIYSQVRPGGLNIEQANNLRARLDHNNLAENAAANKDPFFRDAYEGVTGTIIGNPYNVDNAVRMQARDAGAELRDYYNENVKDKNLADSEKRKLLREKSLELVTHYNKSAAEKISRTQAEKDLVKKTAGEDALAEQQRVEAEQAKIKQQIPPSAIQFLRENPRTVKQFEKTFGLRPGSGAGFLPPAPPVQRNSGFDNRTFN